jgi:hypothetical protein
VEILNSPCYLVRITATLAHQPPTFKNPGGGL